MYDAHGWTEVTLRQRRDDGRCALMTPAHTYVFAAAEAQDAFWDAVLQAADGAARPVIDGEAVDMFVGSVLANDAGRTRADALKSQLLAAVDASEAWGAHL